MTMKKKLLTTLSVVLILGLAALGILAYLTDSDSDVNVMTLGNVDIEQEEVFVQDSPLDPGVTVTKKVTVTNVGESAAYVRTWFAFENPIDKISATGLDIRNPLGTAVIDGSEYSIFVADYGELTNGTVKETLQSVTMSSTATNEDVAKYGDTYEVLVFSQAVQTAGFEDATKAWSESFGVATVDNHPWKNLKKVATADELKAALEAGADVALTKDIELASDEIFATIPAGKSVRLDMAGRKITAALGNQDTGVNAATAVIKVENGASLVIDGDGEFYMTPNKTLNETSTIIWNQGNVKIESGNFEVQSGTSYDGGYIIPSIIENNAANTHDCSPTLTINGGTFTFDRNLIRNFPERLGGMSTITINGGTFTSTDDKAAIWNQWGTQTGTIAPEFLDKHQITINGGTFEKVVISDDFKDVEGANQVIVAPGVNITVE